MINDKYYEDVKRFPTQFEQGFSNARNIKLDGDFNRVVICGVGGSSLFVELLNNYLSTFCKLRLDYARGYELPNYSDEKTLFLVASHSGNTEETTACFDEIKNKNYQYVSFTSGGKLAQLTKEDKGQIVVMPTGIQPRLSTGYFIAGILQVLINVKLIQDIAQEVVEIANKMNDHLEEERAIKIADRIYNKVPIVYAPNNISSLARITKIKFNENTKTQSFWNEFPELNHNEMVGFTNLVMDPFFLIFNSKFTNARNHKRIEVFSKIIQDKNLSLEIINLPGESVLAEILNGYYLADHITLYLSEKYGVDPEPVTLVEDFKKML